MTEECILEGCSIALPMWVSGEKYRGRNWCVAHGRLESECREAALKAENERLTAMLDYAIEYDGFSVRRYNEWRESRSVATRTEIR